MKKIATLFLIPLLFLTACSEDTDMTTYPGRGNEAFFGTTEYSYTVSADLEDAYSIEVLRATPSGNATVPVSITVEDAAVASAFTAPQTVDFVDGEYAAQVKISFDRSKLTIGKENVIAVNLQSETNLPYATACSLTVTRDYTWKDYGTGIFASDILSATFGESISWEQTLQVAEEKPDLYRLANCYHNAGTRYSAAGYHLTFTWNGGSTIGFTVPTDNDGGVSIASGWSHPSYGMVSLYIDTAPEYTGYDAANRMFVFNCCGLVSAGMLYNWGNEIFVLDTVL